MNTLAYALLDRDGRVVAVFLEHEKAMQAVADRRGVRVIDLAQRVAGLEAERDEARAELAQAREVLRALDHAEGRCPLCGWRGHAPDCKLSAALAAKGE